MTRANGAIRKVLGFLAGIVIGMIVNMGIIVLGGSLVAPPEGVDPTNFESIKANIHLYEAKHFVVPFLAHALGTFTGVFVSMKILKRHRLNFAFGIGFWFLFGGIMAASMLNWVMPFSVIDLLFAYIPMALLAYRLAK